MRKKSELSKLVSTCQKRLGYRFKNTDLLLQALTHRSFAYESLEKGIEDNKRLAFLGDSILGMVVSTFLIKRFPHYSEGELTKLKANLVATSTLAKKAKKLRLGDLLHLGKGEILTGGRNRPSILGSGLEAVVGAIYLDGGLKAAEKFILSRLYHSSLQ